MSRRITSPNTEAPKLIGDSVGKLLVIRLQRGQVTERIQALPDQSRNFHSQVSRLVRLPSVEPKSVRGDAVNSGADSLEAQEVQTPTITCDSAV
jgi:hypothetical protein